MYEPYSGDFRLEPSQEIESERWKREMKENTHTEVGRQQKIKRIGARKQDKLNARDGERLGSGRVVPDTSLPIA